MSRVVPARSVRRGPRPATRSIAVAANRSSQIGEARKAATPRATGRLASLILGKLCALALLGATGAGLVHGASASELDLAKVGIVGNQITPVADVLSELPPKGTNLFLVRSARLERLLVSDPAIASARVLPSLPNTIWVTVVERSPAAIWEAASVPMLVDASGLALRSAGPGHARELPVIHANDGPALLPGDQADAEAVRAAEALHSQFDALGLAGGRLEYHPSTGINLVAASQPRVLFGSADDFEAKLAAYQAIRRHLREASASATLIDVRFLQRPYYR